jgi:nitrite reductase/ring-hydroxylating ferredoxin subunit
MTDVHIGAADRFTDPGRKVLDIGGIEVGIFRLSGEFYAYENVCPHLAGPACQGKILPLTLEAVRDDLTSAGRIFSKDRMNVICPWHGFEFDIRTGEHPTDKKFRLKPVPIRIDSGEIYVTLPQRRATG